MDKLEQLTVIGTGLLGTSVALGVRAAGLAHRIVGVGRRAATLDAAYATGGYDEVTSDLPAAVRRSDLILIAVPLSGFDSVFQQLATIVRDDAVLTDVGSTKQSVLAAARKRLSHPGRFVGSHPMAGREQQGPEAASAELCRGKPCIITPEPDTDADALAVVDGLWEALGMRLIRMSAEEHDRETAVISHLPHAMAALIVQVAAELGGWDVASTGFRDTTRLASSNPPMRADILSANRDQVLEALAAMRGQIGRLEAILVRRDRDSLLDLLEQSQRARDRWLSGRPDLRKSAEDPPGQEGE
ncbi:MAG: prephenate dehydrogenase [Phycisphaeraceae bacterium]